MSTKDIIKRARGLSKPFRVTDADGFRLKNFDPRETLHLDSGAVIPLSRPSLRQDHAR